MVGDEVPQGEKVIAKLQDEMNMQQQEVDRSYRRLKRKVLQGTKDGEYKDTRVRELWKRAEAQGLSEEELEVLKVGDLRPLHSRQQFAATCCL